VSNLAPGEIDPMPMKTRNVAQGWTAVKGQPRAGESSTSCYRCPAYPSIYLSQIPFAFAMYKQPDLQHANNFRNTFSRIVEIEFVGVWDTVWNPGASSGHMDVY
jgi:hypothetical protein